MTDVKRCSKCGEWWLDGQAVPVPTEACTHNWVLTSLDTVLPASKQLRAKIRRRTSRRRAQPRNVVRGAVIVISVVFAAVVLVAATKAFSIQIKTQSAGSSSPTRQTPPAMFPG
jgi:hypothetical protein